jgi:outer membrane protein OmpA-like peptidoglycan-associated protein
MRLFESGPTKVAVVASVQRERPGCVWVIAALFVSGTVYMCYAKYVILTHPALSSQVETINRTLQLSVFKQWLTFIMGLCGGTGAILLCLLRRQAVSLFRHGCSSVSSHSRYAQSVVLCGVTALACCTPPHKAPIYTEVSRGPTIYRPDETVNLENSDRIARFQRLASLSGITPPSVTTVQHGAIPVVRVVFSERVMFDFNSDIPRPEAATVLDLVADNMRHDAPDAQLTLLGHADATGSDEYDYDLSMRRARKVFQGLVNRGCDPAQLSAVAIGKNQPIASNDTEEGRVLNRRVEFLISASQNANLGVVGSRQINLAYLRAPNGSPTQPTIHVAVLKPTIPATHTPGMSLLLQPFGDVPLQAPAPLPISVTQPNPRPRPPTTPQIPEPELVPQPQPPAGVHPAPQEQPSQF